MKFMLGIYHLRPKLSFGINLHYGLVRSTTITQYINGFYFEENSDYVLNYELNNNFGLGLKIDYNLFKYITYFGNLSYSFNSTKYYNFSSQFLESGFKFYIGNRKFSPFIIFAYKLELYTFKTNLFDFAGYSGNKDKSTGYVFNYYQPSQIYDDNFMLDKSIKLSNYRVLQSQNFGFGIRYLFKNYFIEIYTTRGNIPFMYSTFDYSPSFSKILYYNFKNENYFSQINRILGELKYNFIISINKPLTYKAYRNK